MIHELIFPVDPIPHLFVIGPALQKDKESFAFGISLKVMLKRCRSLISHRYIKIDYYDVMSLFIQYKDSIIFPDKLSQSNLI
jgi:hypothetical protein